MTPTGNRTQVARITLYLQCYTYIKILQTSDLRKLGFLATFFRPCGPNFELMTNMLIISFIIHSESVCLLKYIPKVSLDLQADEN